MKLCSSYVEKQFENGFKIITIKGEFNNIHIHLLLNNGVNIDSNNKIGISHLCEHIFLETVKELYFQKKSDTNFSCIGYTDYEYTVFSFTISSRNENKKCLLNIIYENINNLNFQSNYINECKIQIKKEFKNINLNFSLKVNKFLTNHMVNYLPIGNFEHIDKLTEKDIRTHYKNYFRNLNLIILENNTVKTINLDNFYLKSFKIPFNSLVENNETKRSEKILKLKDIYNNKNIIRIYFKQTKNNYSEQEKIIECLLEIIMNFKIYAILKNDLKENTIYFNKKIINSEYKYFILYINGINKINETDLKNFIFEILNIKINQSDLEKGKNLFYSFINPSIIIDKKYCFNNVLNYLLNNSPLSITENQIHILHKTLEKICLDDINRLKNELFIMDYKILLI